MNDNDSPDDDIQIAYEKAIQDGLPNHIIIGLLKVIKDKITQQSQDKDN